MVRQPPHDHTRKHNRPPHLYHCATHQPTSTNYSEPPAQRETANSTESGGVTRRQGMQVPWHLLLEGTSLLLKTNRVGVAKTQAPGPWAPESGG